MDYRMKHQQINTTPPPRSDPRPQLRNIATLKQVRGSDLNYQNLTFQEEKFCRVKVRPSDFCNNVSPFSCGRGSDRSGDRGGDLGRESWS